MIYIPKTKEIIVNHKCLMVGEFRLYKGREGQPRIKIADFKNLILDVGLNAIGSYYIAPIRYCFVGTGTSTPAVTQAQLDAPSHSSGLSVSRGYDFFVDGSEPYTQCPFTGRFAPGAFGGNVNLAEIGIGPNSTNTGLFSRARILDLTGTPTTITVLADEYLDIEYVIKMYPPLIDLTGSVLISGVNYNWTSRASMISSISYWRPGMLNAINNPFMYSVTAYTNVTALGTIYQGISGSGMTQAGATTAALPYLDNSLRRESTASWSLTQANSTNGISGFTMSFGNATYGGIASYQMQVNPPIPKDETKSMILNFATSWGRK
jgi:hypothetical protein